jgi:hypothetical protein
MEVDNVYLVPGSRISLLSLSTLLRQGWKADMRYNGGSLGVLDRVKLTGQRPL